MLHRFIVFFSFVSLTIFAEPVRFCVLTIPKSGTHLTKKVVRLLEKEAHLRFDAKFIHYYILGTPFNEANHLKIKKIAVLRDLRDVVVSLVYFWDGSGKDINWMPMDTDDARRYRQLETFDEKLTTILSPGNQFHDFFLRNCQECVKAIENESILQIHFEALVGLKGGGSDTSQRDALLQMILFLGIELEDEALERVQSNIFGGTSTFRKGQIGSWKEEFTQEHEALFEEYLGSINRSLGYL